MRPVPRDVTERMAAFAARHGNEPLAEALDQGRLVLLFVQGKEAMELRVVSASLASRLELLAARPPQSIGEFWGTWDGDDWSPALEAASRIGARHQTDRVIVNERAAQLLLYGRDVLGGSVLHHDDGLRRGSIAWVTDRRHDVLGLAQVIDHWGSSGPVLRPTVDLGWYLREGG